LVGLALEEENKNHIVKIQIYGLSLKSPPASIILPMRSGNGFMEYV